jgi:hypothetical protein
MQQQQRSSSVATSRTTFAGVAKRWHTWEAPMALDRKRKAEEAEPPRPRKCSASLHTPDDRKRCRPAQPEPTPDESYGELVIDDDDDDDDEAGEPTEGRRPLDAIAEKAMPETVEALSAKIDSMSRRLLDMDERLGLIVRGVSAANWALATHVSVLTESTSNARLVLRGAKSVAAATAKALCARSTGEPEPDASTTGDAETGTIVTVAAERPPMQRAGSLRANKKALA